MNYELHTMPTISNIEVKTYEFLTDIITPRSKFDGGNLAADNNNENGWSNRTELMAARV